MHVLAEALQFQRELRFWPCELVLLIGKRFLVFFRMCEVYKSRGDSACCARHIEAILSTEIDLELIMT